MTSGETRAHQPQTIQHSTEKTARLPRKVALDLLNDVRRGKLFCLTPRMQVGLGWLLLPAFATTRVASHAIADHQES